MYADAAHAAGRSPPPISPLSRWLLESTVAQDLTLVSLPLHRVAGTPRGRFADMILANATIYTADPARPFAAAMAVRAGRVLRVGTYESVRELKGRHTYELNLSGNVVLPGFIDSHVHFIEGGLQVCLPPITHGHSPIPNLLSDVTVD